jgi:uroporphyrinogen-III synthase
MGEEARRLFEKHGATVLGAPALQEVPLEDQRSAIEFGTCLFRDEVDVLVLLTGVGTRLLIEVLERHWEPAAVISALGRIKTLCRGPKPVAALKGFGLRPSIVVPEPNTWRDVVATFERERPQLGQRIWVQEYGRSNPDVIQALSAAATNLRTVAVYGWSLPDDLEPLKAAIAAMIAGTVRLACFTTGVQIDHLFAVAKRLSLDGALQRALRERVVIASIGPLTTERLASYGLGADIEPDHPKLGHLVRSIAARAGQGSLHKR